MSLSEKSRCDNSDSFTRPCGPAHRSGRHASFMGGCRGTLDGPKKLAFLAFPTHLYCLSIVQSPCVSYGRKVGLWKMLTCDTRWNQVINSNFNAFKLKWVTFLASKFVREIKYDLNYLLNRISNIENRMLSKCKEIAIFLLNNSFRIKSGENRGK